MVEKKKSPLYPDLKDDAEENETRRELLAGEEGVSSLTYLFHSTPFLGRNEGGGGFGGEKASSCAGSASHLFWQLHTWDFHRLP